jgi:hypothetical protein
MRALMRPFIVAAALVVVPAVGALAQPGDATNNYGNNRSVTAAPGTADNQAASGMHTGDVGPTGSYSPTGTTSRSSSSANPQRSGATGQTVVPGDNSTVANTAGNTRTQQTQGTTSSGSK